MTDQDTSGFYKLDGDQLLHGPNWVVNRDYTLHRDLDADLGFSVDGWQFYPSEDAARTALGLPVVAEVITHEVEAALVEAGWTPPADA